MRPEDLYTLWACSHRRMTSSSLALQRRGRSDDFSSELSVASKYKQYTWQSLTFLRSVKATVELRYAISVIPSPQTL